MLGRKKDQRPDSPFQLPRETSRSSIRSSSRNNASGHLLKIIVIATLIIIVIGVGVFILAVIFGGEDLNAPTSQQYTTAQLQSMEKQRVWRKMEEWNGLRQGMSKDEVRNLFGRPMSQSKQPHGVEVWEYYNASMLGSGAPDALKIYFERDQRVCAWNRPRTTQEN